MKNAILLSALLLASSFAEAQTLGVGDIGAYPKEMVSTSVASNGETIVQITEFTCVVTAQRSFKNAKDKAKWDKLKRDVKKAYPFAVMAKMKLSEMDAQMAMISGEAAKKTFAEKCEDELVSQFEVDMRNLTATQGRILIKLMDRETNSTTYQIIKQYRGSFSAFMWQGVAVVFGNNLKADYDANGDDAKIEEVVQMIELGLI